jgi:nucleoside-diphosphate-sugar epimerase
LLSAGHVVGVQRFVAQSNVALYARTGAAVKSEDDSHDPSPVPPMRANVEGMVHLERAVLGARGMEGIVLRYGWFYGPGASMAASEESFEMVRRRKFPLVGDGGAVWSFIHIADAAGATVAAIEHQGNRRTSPLPGLPGLPVDGGSHVPDVAGHPLRAETPAEFSVPAVPNRRFVAQATRDRWQPVDSLPGGVSEDLASRFEQNLLGDWLTNETYPVRMYPGDLVGTVASMTRLPSKRGR